MAKIFIAEDVPDIADVLTRLFRRDGHHVDAAANAGQTLRAALSDPPDLLIMNLDLPDADSLDVCRRLRADPATAKLPIMVLSVRQDPDEARAAHDAGADDYIGKPFDIHDITTRADTLITRNPPAA